MQTTHNTILQDIEIKPKIGFVGVGWIGLNRLQAIKKENIITVDAIADTDTDKLNQAATAVPEAKVYSAIEDILTEKPQGVVIATPSATHAELSVKALESGAAVFCQKPLGRTASETQMVVDTAKKNNKLLGVDFSYRFTRGMQKIYQLAQSGALGNIYAANLVFHNAYGPDKDWFYKPELSGGGCVIDLGSHLIDLAMWILDFPAISNVSSSLFAQGKPILKPETETEDYAVANIVTEKGTHIQLSCSWNLHTGQDALIEATFFGTKGGATFRNVNGSFYDFETFRNYNKTKRELLDSPPDKWGGKAAINWSERLANHEGFNQEAFEFIKVAEVIDMIYKRNTL